MPYKNKEDRIKNSKEYYDLNKEKIKSYTKEWSLLNKDKIYRYQRKSAGKQRESGYQKSYYSDNSDKLKARSREHGKLWRKTYPDKAKNQTLKKKYGITLEVYNRQMSLQNNKCACCSLDFDISDIKRKPQVDHCHKTGRFRGILCRTCNIVEGFLNKKSDVISMVIDYIERG